MCFNFLNLKVKNFILFSAILVNPLISQGSLAGAAKVYKVGNEGYDFKPHYYMQDGKKVGFEVDLLNEIFKRMGRSYKLVDRYEDAAFSANSKLPQSGPIDFKDILGILDVRSKDGNKYALDMVTSALSITEERKQVVDFSIPIVSSTAYFFGKTSAVAINSIPNDLVGKVVGVEQNSIQESYLRYLNAKLAKSTGQLDAIKIVPIGAQGGKSAIEMVFENFVNGQVEAIVVCDDLFQMRLEKDPAKYQGLGRVSPALNGLFGGEKLGSGNGFAFRKKDPVSANLRKKINSVLKNMLDDCTYSGIFFAYFNYDNPLIPEKCKTRESIQ